MYAPDLHIRALSYVVVATPKLAQWCSVAVNLIGVHVDSIVHERVVRFRMDDKVQRFVVEATQGESSLAVGYEVDDFHALAKVRAQLEAAGYKATDGTSEEISRRGVEAMFHFSDPDGHRVEVAHGLADAGTPFCPGRPLGGFRTGELGIGHIALKAGRYREMCSLYRDVLHFQLSDHATLPFAAEFYHVNPRHHTIGLADTGTGAGVYHLMLEYNDWDDVGRAYDMALETPSSIGVTLGRHTNDHVTSFYLITPDGWMLELGWAGRLIGTDWEVTELPGLSLWGHDRTWLPAPKRAEARELLRTLSRKGLRAPVSVVTPSPSKRGENT